MTEKRKRAEAAVSSVLAPAKVEAEFLRIRDGHEGPDVSQPACPDCGMTLVFNRQMKRWDCECGYQGKKAQ